MAIHYFSVLYRIKRIDYNEFINQKAKKQFVRRKNTLQDVACSLKKVFFIHALVEGISNDFRKVKTRVRKNMKRIIIGGKQYEYTI